MKKKLSGALLLAGVIVAGFIFIAMTTPSQRDLINSEMGQKQKMLHAKMDLLIHNLQDDESKESSTVYENLPTDLEWHISITNCDQDPKIVLNLVDNRDGAKFKSVGLMAYQNEDGNMVKRNFFTD